MLPSRGLVAGSEMRHLTESVIALFLVVLVGCSVQSPSLKTANATAASPSPPVKAVQTPKLKAPAARATVVKSPEAEADQLFEILTERGDWSSSGMTRHGHYRLVQGAWVLDQGGLLVDICDWFWELDPTDMKDRLEGLHRVWARVHSPEDPSKSTLFCTIPSMGSDRLKAEGDPLDAIPLRVGSRGLSARRAKTLWNETRGTMSSKTRARYKLQLLSLRSDSYESPNWD